MNRARRLQGRASGDRGTPGAPERITYLDHASTSPVRPAVAAAMAPFASERFGNAMGSHRLARAARHALEDAREEVAAHMGSAPSEVVFTSGGTESDNLAVLGTLAARAERGDAGGTVLCSAVEHAAVLEPCRAVAKDSSRTGTAFQLVEVGVDGDGVLDLGMLENLLGDHVDLVSIMLANNEVGTVQPLAGVVEAVRRRAPTALVHSDAVQAATYLDLVETLAGVDLVSISAHKLGGPKGVGALVVRRGVALRPLLLGGGHEMERRSGTHDVAGAVGLAVALRAAAEARHTERTRVGSLRDRLADGLRGAVPKLSETAPRSKVLPGHCHVCIDGVEREELLVALDEQGVCASSGAACASGALEPSHVLAAMGVPAGRSGGALRFTLGHTTTAADVEHALAVVPAVVSRLAA